MEKGSDKFKMVYRYLGNTGLKVSLFSFGTMLTEHTEDSESKWLEWAKAAFEAGVNYFDSAESYWSGKGDLLLGKLLKANNWRREELVVAVKVFASGIQGPNQTGLSRKKIIEACRNSLKRMGLDYCDLIFAHRWDPFVPIEEICGAFNWLIKKGYAMYWGTSVWPPEKIVEAIKIWDRKGWARPVAEQCEYNLFIREHVEATYRRLIENYGLGTTIWSPLGGGMFTGKYNDGKIHEGDRYAKNEMFKNFAWDKYLGESVKEKRLKILNDTKELAEELGVTQAQLSLAWTLVNKDVSSCIIGASKLSQLEDNLKALELASNWTPELEEKMEKILNSDIPKQMDWVIMQNVPSRRSIRMAYDIELGKVQYRDPDQTAYD